MNKKFLLNKTTILAASAVALLALSAVGSTSAAINATTNEAIVADIATSNVAVSLMENGKLVENNALLSNLLAKDENDKAESFKIGKIYDEAISFVNGEAYEAYARVTITKSWFDGVNKDQTLNPALIDLTLVSDKDENGNIVWILDEKASTPERSVYYFVKPVAAGATVDVTKTLTVNNVITEIVTKNKVTGASDGTITTTYNYDGKSFAIDVKVDEIQTHNAYDAARASWGVYLDIDENGTITKVAHEAVTSEVEEEVISEENQVVEEEVQTNEN